MSNVLYCGDNLDILRRYVGDGTVDLVYLDPPFKSDQNYNVLFKERDGTRRGQRAPKLRTIDSGERSNGMESYSNLAGDSGVVAYEIGTDFIRVQFRKGPIYLYTYASTGSVDIETMKTLARSGRGLNTFIDTAVRGRYASKQP